jgi:hypothetical protein
MGKMIDKAIWLSFDLGVGGDYPRLYNWLDNHDAIECGDSVAFFKYRIDSSKEDELVNLLKKDLNKAVTIRSGDRMYIVRREVTDSGCIVRGTFLFGKRKGSPWEGYGNKTTEEDE